MNFNLMDFYIGKNMVSHKHIQKNKINDSFKTIYFFWGGKFLAFKINLNWKKI
jgi:hypothetical protein